MCGLRRVFLKTSRVCISISYSVEDIEKGGISSKSRNRVFRAIWKVKTGEMELSVFYKWKVE